MYIDKYQHLPEMPSEQEVAENGVNLGEIVKLQTKKIEELTLYLLEKEMQLATEMQINTIQKSQIKQQDARIAAIEKALLKLTNK
jgi:hypothetical protein